MGIKHYFELDDQEKLYLQGHLEMNTKAKVSVKIDGSANIGFGVDDDGKVYIARFVKGQNEKIYDIEHYPKTPQYNAIRTAGAAILNSSDVITGVLKSGDYANAEILYEATPNVITYDGNNYIFIHDDRFTDLDDNVFTSTIDVYKLTGAGTDPDNVYIGKFTETNEFIVKSNKKVEIDLPCFKHRSGTTLPPSNEQLLSLLDDSDLSNMWSTEAKPFHEGIVVEYPNLIFKVVGDFPKLNKAQWKIREYIEDGYTDETGWVYGLRYQYFDDVANTIGLPLIKAPSRKHYINKNYTGYNFFDRVVQLLEDKEISIDASTIDNIYTLTTTFINGKFAGVKSLIWDATYLQDINYRKTLESYVHHRDYYLSVEKHIGIVYAKFDKPIEQLASILCFILKEEIVKDTFMKKVFRFLKKPLTNNQ